MFKIIIVSFVVCFILERLFAGWKLPRVHSWFQRVILINAVQLSIVVLAGFSWERWLSSASLFHVSNFLNPWGSGFLAYFIATFVFYWWHRIRHQNDFFWRYFHQIHHSPQRLEVITSFYKHPLEMIVNSVIGSLIVYTFLGLSVEAGAIYTLFTALGEFFYHTNMKTPQWVGFLFQRPEMHRIHHQKNYHKNNYGDFVIWDMLFGTFENPKTWSNQCGFDETKELKLKEMLSFKDVHKAALLIALSAGLGFSPRASADTLLEICLEAKNNVAEGDLIFLDIPAMPFRKIAETTKTWTSHVGIVFLNEQGEWVVSESKVPFAKDTLLCDFIKHSANSRFEIRRLKRPLQKTEVELMRTKAKSLLGKPYTLSFNFDSDLLFCSKFAYLTYQAIKIQVGQLQTFKQLLDENQDAPLSFWRIWYFGFIPWANRTVTPASQLLDTQFVTILARQMEI